MLYASTMTQVNENLNGFKQQQEKLQEIRQDERHQEKINKMKRLKPQMQVVYTNDTSDEMRKLQIENEKVSAVNFDLLIKLNE